jgi:hypothetical protein
VSPSRQIIPANVITGVNSTRKTRFRTEGDSAFAPKSINFANYLLSGQEFNFLLMIRGHLPGIIRTSTPKPWARLSLYFEARRVMDASFSFQSYYPVKTGSAQT